ncbi:30S ribosomal protein S19 [Gammaproteobacteria bacterium]|nr:30S ribosomal protein S19 [Gammaproteobacteria bacterium]
MARSLKKGVFIDRSVLKKVKKNAGSLKPIMTKSRRSTIIKTMVGVNMQIHHGNGYTEVHIVPEMVGKKLGEFAPTRKQARHAKKDERGK